jgi:hypothetical protein
MARLQREPDFAVEYTGLSREQWFCARWRLLGLGDEVFGLHGSIEPPQGLICQRQSLLDRFGLFRGVWSFIPTGQARGYEVSKFDVPEAKVADLDAKLD